MRLIDLIAAHAAARPDSVAQRTSEGEEITYGELWRSSAALAAYLAAEVPAACARTAPVMVYGHKSPLMLASMLACIRAGRPYVPIDRHSVPAERVAGIAAQLPRPTVLASERFPQAAGAAAGTVLTRPALEALIGEGGDVAPGRAISGEDTCYILFTSGSTGAPKGVEVTAACVDNFLAWDLTLGGVDPTGLTYLDQAPFSFDLSVFELAGALGAGGTLASITHDTQESIADQLAALAAAGIDIWVSTPSYADLMLAAPEFGAELLPTVKLFIFCGEALANTTAARLAERFPAARILNTYGPTESTVAVTQVEVTPEMAAAAEPLPVGAPRPGTRLRIVDAAGGSCAPGVPGEVVIEGDTVAKGYFGRSDLTARSFSTVTWEDGTRVRSYRTGDEGYLDKAGLLRYRGRLDLQVKLNGFRIELGEIDEQLRRLPGVDAAATTAPARDGKVTHLVAHVVYSGERLPDESDFRLGLRLKEALRATLPHYMIPKKVVFLDALPMTGNGKVDRRALAEGRR